MFDMPLKNKSNVVNIYLYKEDLALNNLQCLMGHKTKKTQTNWSVCDNSNTWNSLTVCLNCIIGIT